MLGRRRNRLEGRDDVIVEHGPSLAKGPNLIIGSILLAYGLSGLLTNADFPSFSQSFPDASAHGESWLGPEVNGWTNFLTIAAGGLLLFGAAQHHLAKLMSLIVGLALAAAAIIGLVDGDVLGLAAANGWTELGWGIAAVLLLLNVFSPRRTRERPVGAAYGGETAPSYARDDEVAATPAATTVHRDDRFSRDDADRDQVETERLEEQRRRDETAIAEHDRSGAVPSRRDDRV
jgi:Domain of unknown function (DUF4383)